MQPTAQEVEEVRGLKRAQLHPALWYLTLRGADAFRAVHGRVPGVGGAAGDAEALWERVQQVAGELGLRLPPPPIFSLEHAREVCRAGGGEPHCTASFIGGLASQEALKVIVGQFVPSNFVVWSSVGGYAWQAYPGGRLEGY